MRYTNKNLVSKIIKEDNSKIKNLIDDIKSRNERYKYLINNPPDITKNEPMELYYWAKEIADLFLK
jgi:23S rRNA A1618 N6-methylase RlmF